jgi:hypothetical protein
MRGDKGADYEEEFVKFPIQWRPRNRVNVRSPTPEAIWRPARVEFLNLPQDST